MVYIKIIIGLLLWGVLFFYGGSIWLDSKREEACTSEVNKDNPNLKVVHKRCLQTAEHYIESEDYGSASWFLLLAGEYEKNIKEVESKISSDFFMNIGHSYLLAGDYEKAKEIYEKYPWARTTDFNYADENIQPDFIILPKIYKDKKEQISKGVMLWNEIYKPLDKIVQANRAYLLAKDSKEQIVALKKYLKYAEPYKERTVIDYIKRKEELAELYSFESLERESIAVYEELLDIYDNNKTTKYEEIDTVLTIARIYDSYLFDYNKSLEYYDKALYLTLEANDTDILPLNIETIYENIADIYSQTSQYDKVLEYHKKALKYIEKSKSKNYAALASIYANIAEVCYVKKRYKLSIENYTKAIKLKKEELINSEEVFLDNLFDVLESYYYKQADSYAALKMDKKAEETKKAYFQFLQHEYETHYNLIASAYDKMAQEEENSSKSVEYELEAIKYIKHAIETDWGELKMEHNSLLYTYMKSLKVYLYDMYSDEEKALKLYLSYVDLFEKFQEKTFSEEESSQVVMAESYNFIANVYKDFDIDKSRKYAEKSVNFLEKSILDIDGVDDEKESIYSSRLNKYYNDLWSIYSLSDMDVNNSIEKYFKFKKSHYEEGSEELITAYETVGGFYINLAKIDRAVNSYKKALNEALINNKENRNIYLISNDIATLQEFYLNRDIVSHSQAVKLLNELIVWQKSYYKDRFSIAKSYEALAERYSDKNNTRMVEESYDKALSLYYKYKKEENESYGVLASLREVYKSLSLYYIKLNSKEKAIENFEIFIAYVEKNFPDEREQQSENYKVLAHIYSVMENKKMVKRCLEKSKILEVTQPLKL